ncbi:MAG: hypothetical protein QOH74_278, partial [Gaiellales bacterium]|nr:hypothetical protein [Gaiellales bacterium]
MAVQTEASDLEAISALVTRVNS